MIPVKKKGFTTEDTEVTESQKKDFQYYSQLNSLSVPSVSSVVEKVFYAQNRFHRYIFHEMKTTSAAKVFGSLSLLLCLTGTAISGCHGESRPRADLEGRAVACRITREDQLIGGESARGRLGDYLLANEKIRLIIRGPGRVVGFSAYGGNIIDADRVRPAGEAGSDSFGQLNLFFDLGLTADHLSVRVAEDGSNGRAVVRAEGEDALFDAMNIRAELVRFGLAPLLPYDIDRDFPLKITTDYILRPGCSYVEVVTTFENTGAEALHLLPGDFIDSVGDLDIYFAGGGKGFGDQLLLDIDFIAMAGHGISYGYVPDPFPPDETCLTPLNIGIQSVKGSTILPNQDVLGVLLNRRDCKVGVTPGGVGRYRRYFAVGEGDVASIRDAVHEIRGDPVGTLAGRVTEATTSAPLHGASIAVLGPLPGGQAFSQHTTKKGGLFEGNLPPGEYRIRAHQEGRPFGDGLLIPKEYTVEIRAGEQTELEMRLPGTCRVRYTVRDAAGTALPSKLSVVGIDPSPPENFFADFTRNPMPEGLARVDFTRTGAGEFVLEPGRYKLVASRGIEYSADSERVELSAGGTVDLGFRLDRIIDTAGYISADLHIHALPSWDSDIPMGERLTVFAAEGVELLGATDHFVITDYSDLIRELGLSEWVCSVPGQEITTTSYGHFNGFPMRFVPFPDSINGGAIDWGIGNGREFVLTPGEIFRAIRENLPEAAPVVQVNHPYGRAAGLFEMGYFNVVDLTFDPAAGRAFAGDKALDPEVLRMGPGAEILSLDFDAIEVINGLWTWASEQQGCSVEHNVHVRLWAWFNFLNMGRRYTGTGNTDSHTAMDVGNGYPRNMIRVSRDDPAAVDMGEVIESLRGMKTLVTNGPFVEVSLRSPASGEEGGMGALIHAPDGDVELAIRVTSPLWAPFDRIEIYANPDLPGDLDRFNPYRLCEYAARIIEIVPGATGRGAAGVDGEEGGRGVRNEYETVEPFHLDRDTWFVVKLTGSYPLFPVLPNGISTGHSLEELLEGDFREGEGVGAWAITNPVFVDVDGDRDGDGDDFEPLWPGRSPCRLIFPG